MIQSFVLGGGCFWCIDAVYRNFQGITASICGYSGGEMQNPDYRSVCSGSTGHIEVVKVEFDDEIIDADTVLDIFFTSHDPTSMDRQGYDVGTQYRSAMLYADDAQKQVFEAAIARNQKLYDAPIVTVVQPLEKFWDAENYHQNYYANNPFEGYCMAIINPKLSKARQHYARFLRA